MSVARYPEVYRRVTGSCGTLDRSTFSLFENKQNSILPDAGAYAPTREFPAAHSDHNRKERFEFNACATGSGLVVCGSIVAFYDSPAAPGVAAYIGRCPFAALSTLKRKVALVLAPLLIGVFVAGVFASSTPLGGSITSMFITNWPHSQNVSITNWPKPTAGNTTVIVKTVYINQSTVINATRFFIVANHTIPFTGPYSQVYGVVTSYNGCNGIGPVQGGNVTFTPHNTSLPTLSSIIQTTSGYYAIDVPSNQSYLVHIFYYPCDQPLRDCFVPANPTIAIDRIDFSCLD